MKTVNLHHCKEGVRLGESIIEPFTNRVLLNKGHKLTKDMIKKLIDKGYVYVKVDENYHNAVFLAAEQAQENRKLTEEVKARLDSMIRLTSDDKALTEKVEAISHGKGFKELSTVLKKLINESIRNRNLFSMIVTLQTEKEGYFFQHGLNTLIYSIAIGVQMGLKDEQFYALGLGALLHDIGKTFISEEILYTTERDDEQEKVYNRHTIIGYELIKRYSDISLLAAHCAYQHHENYNGSGFPRGIKGDDIHLLARIVAVADTYDTLLNPHDGSKRLLPHEAFEVLNGYCYTRFDPKVVAAFHQAIAIYPIGTEVTLNTGERAVVYHNNNFAPHRPSVAFLTDETHPSSSTPTNIDLSKRENQTILIVDFEPSLEVPTS